MVFVKADGSQAEARVVAALCEDGPLLAKFEDPSFDIHVENAVLVYGGTPEAIIAEDRLRAAGKLPDSRRRKTKGVTHGANYQGGPRIAQKQADIPFSEAKVAIERYRAGKPLLLAWWRRVEETLLRYHMMRTVWGRHRIFMGRIDEATLREATAYEPQSTVGDLINHAFFQLDAALEAIGGWPLLQAHDEVVCEVPKGREAEGVALVRKWLELPLPFARGPLRIPAEVAIGPNWYDLEKVHE